MKVSKMMFAAAAMTLASTVYAAGGHSGGHGEGFGEAGKADDVTRTIEVTMQDNYFEPEEIEVAQGETVRFVIQNNGSLVHEFNIGTPAMHEAHQKEMVMMVEHGVIQGGKLNEERMNMDMGNGHTMKHDDPNSVLLEPGQKKEIIWTFSAKTSMEFACNIPGHYQSGMYGDVNFESGTDTHASAH